MKKSQRFSEADRLFLIFDICFVLLDHLTVQSQSTNGFVNQRGNPQGANREN